MFDQKVNLKIVIILILISILMASGTTYILAQTPTSTFTISPGIYPGSPSYTIWRESNYYYAKDSNGAIKYSGTNADTVINNAINDISSGIIFLTKGTYEITGIQLDDNKHLIGEGWDTILKIPNGNTDNISLIRIGSSSSIRNLKLDGNRRTNFPNKFGDILAVQNGIIVGRPSVVAKNVLIDTVYIYDFHTHGIWVPTRDVSDYHYNIQIVNCKIESCNWGALFEDARNIKSINTDYIGCNTHSFSVWADIQNVGLRNFLILGGTFDGYNSIEASNLKNQIIVRSAGDNVKIIGAEILNGNDHAIDLYSQTIVSDCVIYNNAYSAVRLQKGSNYSQILNCKIFNQQHYGIRIIAANDILIANCYIADNSQITTQTYDGVSIQDAVRCAILNCRITGTSHRYGVDETGTSDYTLLDGSVLSGNGVGAHTVDALNSIVGDIIA